MSLNAVSVFSGLINFFIKKKRLYWIFVLFISGWSTVTIFTLINNRFVTDSTSIGVATSYSRWTNTFPSIGICLSKNRITEDFTNAVKKRFPGEKPSYTYIRTLYDYLFINPNNLYLKWEYCRNLNTTCGVDILAMRRELFAMVCTDFFEEIYFSEILLPDCEHIFKFHELEVGYCFLANNLLDYKNIYDMPLRYSSLEKYRTLRLILRAGLVYRYDLYINSPEDLPYFNAVSYTVTGEPTVHSFNAEEIYNDAYVIYEPVSQRMCKFPTESSTPEISYSFSICMSNIRSQIEMELCNCTLFSHINRSSKNYCGVEEIACLDSGNLAAKVRNYVGFNMACLPSCVEQQITFVGSREKTYNISETSNIVEIEIASPPTSRYYRSITQTKLDLWPLEV
ncbi:uncharacterized protein LOC110191690 [Drosophila serrata]|uniref:uncharacterized protein LOC110191690 n=1 Tax=Drosophila serrata TaxID=7274 RepID=UPI000A1CFB9B|nr:uncharacterized protein LOC110191690 [Drosophila serrata]